MICISLLSPHVFFRSTVQCSLIQLSCQNTFSSVCILFCSIFHFAVAVYSSDYVGVLNHMLFFSRWHLFACNIVLHSDAYTCDVAPKLSLFIHCLISCLEICTHTHTHTRFVGSFYDCISLEYTGAGVHGMHVAGVW